MDFIFLYGKRIASKPNGIYGISQKADIWYVFIYLPLIVKKIGLPRMERNKIYSFSDFFCTFLFIILACHCVAIATVIPMMM